MRMAFILKEGGRNRNLEHARFSTLGKPWKIEGMARKNLAAKAKTIKMLLLDVDGVMTDGSITYGEECREIKSFNVRDGVSIKWLQREGIEVAILSGRKSKALAFRANELGIKRAIQFEPIKLPAFTKLLAQSGLQAGEVAYIGDDIYDLPVLRRAGLAACPADAVAEVKKASHYVCQAKGGHGAVREVAELILKAQGKWEKIISQFDV
jgi:3-deoxy-D-manno-octulosonate 8-phosphate phosphatase (KDO 8-P phosphatase)